LHGNDRRAGLEPAPTHKKTVILASARGGRRIYTTFSQICR